MVFHNGMIVKGDKEEMKSEPDSELEEKKQPDGTIYNANKEKMGEALKFEMVGKNKTEAPFTALNKAKSSEGDTKKLKSECHVDSHVTVSIAGLYTNELFQTYGSLH